MTDQELADLLGWRSEQRFRARQEQRRRRRGVLEAIDEVDRFIDERQLRREEPDGKTASRGKPALPFASRRVVGLAVGSGAMLVIALAAAVVQVH